MTQIITEAEFPIYFKTIDSERWKKLFDLIPEIQRTNEFGKINMPKNISPELITLPFYSKAEIVASFVEIAYDLGIIIGFDWMGWQEGSKILSNPTSSFEELDAITLCKLLTTIVRADRFNDGFLVINFSDGTVLKILKALNNIIYNTKNEPHSQKK